MRRVILTTMALLSLSPGSHTHAQGTGQPDPLFASDEILQARLTGPVFQFIDKKSKEDYLQGTFGITDEDGATLDFDLQFRARGNFRHDRCDYPPIRLNFKKSQTKNTLLDKQDKLKLVVHCNHAAEYRQIVLQEYLAYRVLNLLTDLSLRVRLLQIVYADPDKEFVSEPRYAFIIEDKKRAGKRIGMDEQHVSRTTVGAIDPAQLNLTSVFQFFIGNTDFSPIAAAPGDDCCHNYILYQGPGSAITPIPFDFDLSGFVDAPYAEADPRLRLRTVKQRRYRGRCQNNQFVENSLQKLLDRKDDIYALINAQVGFADKPRRELIRFVDHFYELATNPRRVESTILKRCL